MYLDSQSSSQHIFASRTPVPARSQQAQSTSRWAPSPVPTSPIMSMTHSDPLPMASRASSSKWAGNDRAGIQKWAQGVWGTATSDEDIAEDDSDRLSFSSRQSGSTQARSSRRTRRRATSPLLTSSAPRLLTSQRLAAPAISVAPLARASTLNSSDDDLTSLMTPSSASSAAIPLAKPRAWQQQDDCDPFISSPPYESFLDTRKAPYSPQRGRPLVRPDWF
jgi:hypothetical protein